MMGPDAVNRAAGSAVAEVATGRGEGVLISLGAVLTIEGTRMAGAEIRGGCYDCPDGRDD